MSITNQNVRELVKDDRVLIHHPAPAVRDPKCTRKCCNAWDEELTVWRLTRYQTGKTRVCLGTCSVMFPNDVIQMRRA